MNVEEKSLFKAIVAHVPELIVEELVHDPHLPAERGQFRHGTLVFADVSGFTAMSEKLAQVGKEGAEELTSILNRYFTDMLNVALSYHGTLLKFGGDAMLILFLGHRHAARGVRCAMRMQEAMRGFGRVATSQGTFELAMSIGINTGEFFEASVGPPEERLYCVFTGREVNRTAEIESTANAGEVFVGAGTLHELGDSIRVGDEREGHYQLSGLDARVRQVVAQEPYPARGESAAVTERLATYLPRQLAERIKADPHHAEVEGEHRRVTTMFVNLLGTSEVAEDYGQGRTEEITRVLHECFLMVHETVGKYEGLVVGCDLNTRGDKLLVGFGAPVAHEDDDERALRCALEVKDRLSGSGLPLRLRIGVNTGYVFSGEVGSPSRKEYTVMGDNVNLAARLMGVAEEGEVLASDATCSRLANRFVLRAREPVRVKGKSEPVQAHQVECVREESTPRRQLSAGELVGREEETATIRAVIKRGLAGQGQVLTITGAAGIGKSRLVEELRLLWGQRDGLAYGGDCQSYGAHTPYLPWIDLFSSFFDLHESDTDAARVEKIETLMVDLRPELKDWTAVMGSLLHTPIPESDLLASLDPELRHQRLLDVTLELVQARAERTPLLLLLEDLHWADTASLELVDYVARNVADYPVLVCTVYRPEERLELEAEGQDNYTNISLGRLPPESSLDLVRAMANAEDLPEELSQLIVTKSQGNPLFVEEVVGSLMDTGYLRQDASTGQYRLVGDVRQVEVPDTVQGVIMARLDRLEEETRNVARVASVVGRLFQYPLVKAIYPRPIGDEELTRRLDDLAKLGLTRLERQEPSPEYFFDHILTQEVAYESLLFARRRELHHQIGEYYEGHYIDRLEDHYELLCYHYGRTRDRGKTLEYSIRAGDKAKRMFTNPAAIDYYQMALELAGEMPDDTGRLQSKVLADLGDIYELTGQYDQALESYQASQQWYQGLTRKTKRRRPTEAVGLESLFPHLPSLEDRDGQIAGLSHKRGMVYERKGQYGAALEWLDKGLELLDEANGERARLCTARAGVLYRQGEHAQALEWCRRGLEIASRVADRDEMAHSYYLLGTIYTDMGNVTEAIGYCQRSLTTYEEMNAYLEQAKVHNILGADYYYLGNWEKAKEHYHNSLEIRERIGDVNGVATVSNNLGEVLSDQGYLDEAIESFLLCLTTWERIGYRLGVGLSHSNVGLAYARHGNGEKALDHLMRGRGIFEQLQSKGFLGDVYRRLAEACLRLDRQEVALEHCERSLSLAREQQMPVGEGVACRIMGQIHQASGDWDRAEESLTESLRILRELGVPYELGQTLWHLALLHDDMNRAGHAGHVNTRIRQPLQEAIAIFEGLGVRFDSAKAAELRSRYEANQD